MNTKRLRPCAGTPIYEGLANPLNSFASPCRLSDQFNHIYYPTRTGGSVPKSGNDRNAKYRLIDLFSTGGLRDTQLSEAKMPSSAAKTFYKWGSFKGDKGGGCGNGVTVTCPENAANLPWAWDDHDDGPVYHGEMALDPAHFHSVFHRLGKFQ